MRKRTITTLAFLLGVTSFNGRALDLKGLKIGDECEVTKIKAAFEDPKPFCIKDMGCSGITVVGPAKMRYDVNCFHSDKKNKTIASILLRFEPGYFDVVAPLFIAKFGTPTRDTTEQLQNAYGAQFTNRDVTWEDGLVFLMLTKYQSIEQSVIDLSAKAPARNGSL